MSSLPIRDLRFETTDVGQNIKSSKRLYKWSFYLKDNMHKIELFQSRVSGKRKIMHNGNFIFEDLSYSNDFSHSFNVEKYDCNLVQLDFDRFELRIMNRPFSNLIEEGKNIFK